MRRQLSGGNLDYLTQDFLAEITMSILHKQHARNPQLGYALDFMEQLEESLPFLGKTRIISNAGGINPLACAQRASDLLKRAGLARKIAVVLGDDLLGIVDELLEKGLKLENMESGEPLSSVRNRLLSANAYLGISPLLAALEQGAEMIICGRVTDTAIAAAPPAFEFDWALDDWDSLASGVIAGHLLECGTQATGGNLTDWKAVGSFSEMGFPIVEFAPGGSFIVTKHPSCGGLVNQMTLISQLVYELGDPCQYLTPDVTADFTSIQLQDLGSDRVRVSGARGSPPPSNLKVSIAYHAGFKAHGTLIVSGPHALEKARVVTEILHDRLSADFEEFSAEFVGFNACHHHLATSTHSPNEILLRVGVRALDRESVVEFSKELPALILSSVGGIAIVGARPRIQEVVAYWPALIPRNFVHPEVYLLDSKKRFFPGQSLPPSSVQGKDEPVDSGWQGLGEEPQAEGDRVETTLREICFARSGDKGDTCNIGLAARSWEAYRWLVGQLSAQKVKDYFGDICRGEVERYLLPNLKVINFLLHNSLGGGGTVSLRIDPQGKTLSEALLNMKITLPRRLLD